ncbi:TlpA family protein disulfide reductase [Formosa sp. A9]|uniref:TlpA family protein disulfide reductase n=1 Tax=Formosa sp. A9 TaxID=3442641 RepID=UPI003EBD48BD
MKNIIYLIFAIYSLTIHAQETIKKPEYVMIANNEIITMEEFGALASQNLIKSINKGVSQEERDKYAEKFGNKIGDREFIMRIDILTEEEKANREKQVASSDENKEVLNIKNLENDLILKTNDPAHPFSVRMINDEIINLSELKGKVVLLNFWATWCAPCLMEFAEFPEKILDPYKSEDFVLIPISIGENKEKVEEKMLNMKKYGVHFNVGFDPEKQIWDNYATGAIPKSFVIDKNGIIRYTSIGNFEGNVDKLANKIGELLAE